MSSRPLTVPSFAKINWILKILGKRADGYHELRTVFQTLDLRDEITFEPVSEPVIVLQAGGRQVLGDRGNLVYRAADLLRRTARVQGGVNMRLEKRIPVGAGLGGGSGNAAVTLLALNQLWGCGFDCPQLNRLAAELGSDVPFFLQGGTAFAKGRGEDIECWPDWRPEEALLVVYPHLEISTQAAYALGNWGPWREAPALTKPVLDTKIRRFCKAVERKEKAWTYLENDFQGPLFSHYPLLAELGRSLQDAGCRQVLLCGSGSAILGLAGTSRLEKAAQAILQRRLGEVFLCRTLSRNRYRTILSASGLEWPLKDNV